MTWAQAFLITQLLEMPIYVPFFRGRGAEPRSWARCLLMAFSLSLVTHPVVWFVFPRLIPDSYLGMIVAAESFAIGVEGLMLHRYRVERPFGVSLLANGVSAGTGFLIYAVQGS